MTAPRAPRVFIMHNGDRISLYELSKRTGISYSVLRKRNTDGETGERLIRPMRSVKKRSLEVHEDLKQMAEVKSVKASVQQARRDRTARLVAARERIAAEHAREFARPLIDAKLLKPKERAEIRERVMNAGQRNWRTNGTSL